MHFGMVSLDFNVVDFRLVGELVVVHPDILGDFIVVEFYRIVRLVLIQPASVIDIDFPDVFRVKAEGIAFLEQTFADLNRIHDGVLEVVHPFLHVIYNLADVVTELLVIAEQDLIAFVLIQSDLAFRPALCCRVRRHHLRRVGQKIIQLFLLLFFGHPLPPF